VIAWQEDESPYLRIVEGLRDRGVVTGRVAIDDGARFFVFNGIRKLAPKLDAIKDCAILYVAAIGGSAAARVVAHGIHPIKVNQPEEINHLLTKFQEVLKGNPPPWLRKVLTKGKERVLDFEEEEVKA